MWKLSQLLSTGQRLLPRYGPNLGGTIRVFSDEKNASASGVDGDEEKYREGEDGPPRQRWFQCDSTTTCTLGLIGAGATATVLGDRLFRLEHEEGKKKGLLKVFLTETVPRVWIQQAFLAVRHSVLPDGGRKDSNSGQPSASSSSDWLSSGESDKSWLGIVDTGVQTDLDVNPVAGVRIAEAQFDQVVADYESAMNNWIGVDLIKQGQWSEAYRYFLKSVTSGNPRAEYNLGMCYHNGYGTPQNTEKAIGMWTRAAEKGHADACYQLGVCHVRGLGGLKQDIEAGKKWISLASDAGVPEAQTYVATGSLKMGDEKEGVRLLESAAAAKNPVAESLLKSYWGDGEVEKSPNGTIRTNPVGQESNRVKFAIKGDKNRPSKFWISTNDDSSMGESSVNEEESIGGLKSGLKLEDSNDSVFISFAEKEENGRMENGEMKWKNSLHPHRSYQACLPRPNSVHDFRRM